MYIDLYRTFKVPLRRESTATTLVHSSAAPLKPQGLLSESRVVEGFAPDRTR